MNKTYKQKELRLLPPDERLKKLTESSDLSNIQVNGPVLRYFRSGPQIIKIAEESFNNKQYEDAFFYYMRFITVKKPGIDRSTKPQANTFKDKMYSSFLKTVVIPSRMMQTFLVLSQKNTNNNVETCGILAGRM
ncbi:AMSH-like protease, partial [Sarracenia purpurea var. burkii]